MISFSKLASMALPVALLSAAAALAQAPSLPETVSWTVSVPSAKGVKPGSKLAITIRGDVVESWHIYGLEQLPTGPIPLLVTLDPGSVAVADGAPAASPPVKFHDPSFGLETQYYTKPFTVTLPVRLGADAKPGPQQIPVSIRYQSCNGETCRPPKTVHLTAQINLRGG